MAVANGVHSPFLRLGSSTSSLVIEFQFCPQGTVPTPKGCITAVQASEVILFSVANDWSVDGHVIQIWSSGKISPLRENSSSIFSFFLGILKYILVCLSCHDKCTINWVAYTTKMYFLHFWRLESPRAIHASQFSFWWEPSSWFADGGLPAMSSHGREMMCLLSLLLRALIPLMRLHSHDLTIPQRP